MPSEDEETELLRKFVIDYCDGKIFTDLECDSEHEIRMCFLVLALAGPGVVPANAHRVYEHVSKAGPTAVNGKPIFFSCRFLSTEQWERVKPAITAELKRREEIKV